MAQKLISLEEAADQLGISKERLLALREANKVPGYRDGASWKFRSEAIDKLAAEGIPTIDPGASDLALDLSDDDLGADVPPSPAAAEVSGIDLEMAEDESPSGPESSDLSLENEEMAAGSASDISLDEVDEPTVAGLEDEGSDALALDDADEINLNTDSILMSEAELGAMSNRPPSTIIGKAELDLDADLDLSPVDKGAGPASDVKLAAADSGLVPGGDEDELALDLPSASGDFDNLDELEVDLEAESSRIMSPKDVAKAQSAAKSAAKKKGAELSDIGLAPTGSSMSGATSDVNIGSGVSNVGLSGLSALELDDDDDDQVLGEGSGSDVTLSGESSGINIISPSDSGLALDEVSLDLSGSAPIGSSLDLGESVGSELGVETSGIGSALGLGLGSKVGEDFQLTPLGEGDEDEEKDSSQVIALDELSEEAAGAPLASSFGDVGMAAEDFGSVGLTPGAMPVGVATATEMPFSIWNVLGLTSCMLMLGLCGMMTFDLLRSMWSWEGVSSINSTLLEVLNPFLGR